MEDQPEAFLHLVKHGIPPCKTRHPLCTISANNPKVFKILKFKHKIRTFQMIFNFLIFVEFYSVIYHG